MTLDRLDHVAIEVDDLDAHIAKFVGTGGLRVLRRGTATASGARIAMLGDGVGMKIELIENVSAVGVRFLHVAFRSGDVDAAARDAVARGWVVARGPNPIAAAQARSVFLDDGQGFEFQVLTYEPGSPDIVQSSSQTSQAIDAT